MKKQFRVLIITGIKHDLLTLKYALYNAFTTFYALDKKMLDARIGICGMINY